MPSIFISFRKVDDRVTRARIAQHLVELYGAGGVFKSGDSIPPGTDYVRALKAQARSCPVMLVLIGPGGSLRSHRTVEPGRWTDPETGCASRSVRP